MHTHTHNCAARSRWEVNECMHLCEQGCANTSQSYEGRCKATQVLTRDLKSIRHALDEGRKVILGGPCEIHKPRRGAGQDEVGVNACGTGCSVPQHSTVHELAWVRMLEPLSRHSMGDKKAEPVYLHNLRANICASIWARRCLQSKKPQQQNQ